MKEYYPEGWLSNTLENKRNMNTPAAVSIAMSNKTVIESTALLCDEQHNITVDLGCMKGIIPRDEGAIGIAEGKTRDIALISRVGKPVCFVVKDIKTDNLGRLYALLSRKCAQELSKKSFLATKKAGDIINAKITHLESFGAFCDIGCGNIALLPIDSISVSRISHPKDRFKVGDDIRAIIK
ncbi:MAG: S1 RNA-binding domain-containing protein, partial [Clostridia bacterium]|nr:S1 RNA-binding domain-containing protein [Clostridia bacterium]